MSLANAYDNLATTLTGDTDLTAWAAPIGGPLTLFKGNRLVPNLLDTDLPALVLELGDFQAERLVSGRQHELTVAMKFSIAWKDTDYDAAFDRKQALPELVTRAVMGNPDLNGEVSEAWVSGGLADFGYHHPRHAMGFTVTAELRVTG